MAPLFVHSSGRAPNPSRAARSQTGAATLPYGLPVPPAHLIQRPAGISLCMIVRDEERFLDMCLRSVAGVADELCIVDTGSQDRTLEIAAAFGARIEHRTWRDDFAWARNEALSMATKRWIFVLDADEELDPASVEMLRAVRDVPADVTGLWVRCNNLSDDYKGTGVSTHALVRFFPNNERIRYLSPVHEFITLDRAATGINACQTQLSITHHGYLNAVVQAKNKAQRNLSLVKTATAAAPLEPFNWYNLGTTSLLCGDREGAIASLEKMRELVGTAQRGFVPNALAQLADLYTDSEQYERGVELASESLRAAPNFANAHFALGRALIKLRRFAEGRAAFEAAIADAPFSGQQFIVDDEVSAWKAQSEIGSSYGFEGNDLAALGWFDRALANRPGVVAIRINRAKALERLGRYAEAQTMFADLARAEPGDAHTVDYINFLLRRNDFVGAFKTIEAALEVTTPRTQASLLVVAAKISVSAGFGNVEALLLRALATYGGAADALDELERYYTASGNAAAIAALHRAEVDAPMLVAADYARRATRLLATHRYTDARAVVAAGLEVAPDDPALRYDLGVLLVQTGRKPEALAELTRAGDTGDIGLRAAFLRAIVLGDLGRYAEAVAAIDSVIARAPNEVDARLYRFRFADAQGDDTAAEITLRAALDLGQSRVAAELAAWLLRKGRFADAAAVADRALTAV